MPAGHEKIKQWRNDPVSQVRELYHVEPDAWQVAALQAFGRQDVDKIRIAMKACAGPGKSAAMAWMILNFLSCYCSKGEHPKGAAVSITGENLRDNLWSEVYKFQSRSKFLTTAFEWTGSRIEARGYRDWFVAARTWPKTANEEEMGRTLSGLHGKYAAVFFDESGGIPKGILKAGEQVMSNCSRGWLVQSGNPISQDGMLYASVTVLRDQWVVITITGDPDDASRSPRIDITWAREQIAKYGRSDPWVMAYILGQFPPSAINAILGLEDVEAAQAREMSSRDIDSSEKRIGVDVARFGDDRSYISRRQGLQAVEGYTMRNASGPDLAGKVAQVVHEWGADQIFLDTTGGYGGSPEDSLRQGGFLPISVNFSSKASDDKFFNLRSQILWSLADWVKRGGCLYRSPTLAKELVVITYTFQGGKIRVVEKDQMKKQLGFSPDEADSLATTFALPDKPRGMFKSKAAPARVYMPHCARRK